MDDELPFGSSLADLLVRLLVAELVPWVHAHEHVPVLANAWLQTRSGVVGRGRKEENLEAMEVQMKNIRNLEAGGCGGCGADKTDQIWGNVSVDAIHVVLSPTPDQIAI